MSPEGEAPSIEMRVDRLQNSWVVKLMINQVDNKYNDREDECSRR